MSRPTNAATRSEEPLDALGVAHAELTERLADAMRAGSRAYVAAVIRALDEQGFAGLTPATLSVLTRLEPEGVQTVTLARVTARTKQATGKLVEELEAQGYVERAPDPLDRRGRLVRPTTKGAEALRAGARIKGELAERAYADMGTEAMERLYADLEALERALVRTSPPDTL